MQSKQADELIIKGLRGDDHGALEQLYLQYARRLLLFVGTYLNCKDDSEEIVQEVFVKVWQKRHDLKANESLKSYLFTIAYNAIKKRFVKQQREAGLQKEYAGLFYDETDGAIQPDYETLMQQVNRLVEAMPEKRREIFRLCKKEGLSVQEAAAYLQVSEKTVKNQLTEAYRFLRQELKDVLALVLLFQFLH
ncbi:MULTISPECIES: RNA polymerase sigma factor [unclassified Carboxylicivirga]|uniref:RNA polymerase sigma factor n=1 Tax=Carboxylicivirga TaxID=1628153 RepID=UPI003D357B26